MVISRTILNNYKSDNFYMKKFSENLVKLNYNFNYGDKLKTIVVKTSKKKYYNASLGEKLRIFDPLLIKKEEIDILWYLENNLSKLIAKILFSNPILFALKTEEIIYNYRLYSYTVIDDITKEHIYIFNPIKIIIRIIKNFIKNYPNLKNNTSILIEIIKGEISYLYING